MERKMRKPLGRAFALMLSALLAVFILTVAATAAQNYHGNVQSRIFHAPNCRYYSCAACVAVFPSREKALAAGYRPCKVCKP